MSLLTAGAIELLHSYGSCIDPVLQVLDIKAIAGNVERYRLVVSDGSQYMQAMLSTQMAFHIPQMVTNCVIKVTNSMMNEVNSRRILIILNMELVPSYNPAGGQIGNPQIYGQAAPTPTPQMAPMQPPPSVYNAPKSVYNAPPSSTYHNNGPIQTAPSMTRNNICAIQDLNPYINKWSIRARVTSKTPMKTWSNARGDGNLFSFDLLDAQGGEIRCTAFKEVADKFFAIIQAGEVYEISHGQLKVANSNFTHLKHEYEITLGRESEISGPITTSETQQILQMKFEIVPINQIESIPPNSFIDVCGVITDISPLSTIVSSKTNKEITKRSISLVDQSNLAIELTVWGESALEWDESRCAHHPVLAVKGCRVSDFGGRSLSTVQSSTLALSPASLPLAQTLASWYANRGSNAPAPMSLSKRSGAGGSIAGLPFKECGELTLDNLSLLDPSKPEIFLLTATINVLQFNADRPPWYLACPSQDCNKKVTDNGQGAWFCEKCNKAYPTCDARYIFSFAVSDRSGSQWCSVFNDVGQEILHGKSAQELKLYLESGDTATLENAFRTANFTEHTFKIRAKQEMMQDQPKLRFTVLSMLPVDHAAECCRAISNISAY